MVLLAVADAAGGEWPGRARQAAISLVAQSKESTPSLGLRLLDDLRDVFASAEVMSTVDILTGLHAIEEAPWADMRGKQLDARGLSNRLRAYDIRRKQVRIGPWSGKGYEAIDLADAWTRYLSPSPAKSETSETSETTAENRLFSSPANSETSETNGENVSDVSDVSDYAAANAETINIDDDLVEVTL